MKSQKTDSAKISGCLVGRLNHARRVLEESRQKITKNTPRCKYTSKLLVQWERSWIGPRTVVSHSNSIVMLVQGLPWRTLNTLWWLMGLNNKTNCIYTKPTSSCAFYNLSSDSKRSVKVSVTSCLINGWLSRVVHSSLVSGWTRNISERSKN